MASKKLSDIPADVRRLSFEKARQELEEIVRKLESGEVDLEESITTYSRGIFLKRHCEAKLSEAREKIEKIELVANDKIIAKPVEEE